MPKRIVRYSSSAVAGMQKLQQTASTESLKTMAAYLRMLDTKNICLDLDDSKDLKLKECKKIYFGEESQYRIVYEILDDGNVDILFIDILAVGLRESFDVYVDAHIERMNRKKKNTD